jgi:hypothetical protein
MAGVSLIDDRAALLSLRNSDFDAYSAVGEVIDNSIQADATTIRLLVQFKSKGQEPITSIAFGDDGTGMSSDILHRCLQLGYSTRYNDRRGIGRFGVGATLAAFNQCKKIDVSSKTIGGEWLHTHVDLDAITADPPRMKGIPTPSKRDLPGPHLELVGQDSGTLVVWSKYDRQPEPASKLIEELRVWAGRTYRKFIWDGVRIFINGDVVPAIDPLYVTTAGTKFPDDPRAAEYEEILLPWPIPPADRRDGGPEESIVRIRMSLLPEEFRPTEASGHSRPAKARCIDLNEGVSILRNNREVFYDIIPWWPGTPFRGIDRWWGCEISFDAILDSQFTVRNIKRGAAPVREVKQAIKEKIEPTRHAALEQIRNHWKGVESPAWADKPSRAASAVAATAPALPAFSMRSPLATVARHGVKFSLTKTAVFGSAALAGVSAGVYLVAQVGRGNAVDASTAWAGPVAPSNYQDVISLPDPVSAAGWSVKARPAVQSKTDLKLTDFAPSASPTLSLEPVRAPASERTGFVLGMGQRGRVGEPAPLPVVFEVRDSSGIALPGVPVSLSIVNGQLVDAQGETDTAGQVRAQVVFGPRAGVRTVVTGTVGALVREAALLPAAGLPAKLVVQLDGNALVDQINLAAGQLVELRIAAGDAYDNALPLVGLRATVGDDHVVQVARVVLDSLGGSVTVRAGRGGATNLVIYGSGQRIELSALVAPAVASP